MRFLIERPDEVRDGELFEGTIGYEDIEDIYVEKEIEKIAKLSPKFVTVKDLPNGIKLKDVPFELDKDLFAEGNVIEMGSDYTVLRLVINSVEGIIIIATEAHFNAQIEVSIVDLLEADYKVVLKEEFDSRQQVNVGDVFKIDHPFVKEYCRLLEVDEDGVVVQIITHEDKEPYGIRKHHDWLKYSVSKIYLTASEVDDLVNGKGCSLDDNYSVLKEDLIRLHGIEINVPKEDSIHVSGKIKRNYDIELIDKEEICK